MTGVFFFFFQKLDIEKKTKKKKMNFNRIETNHKICQIDYAFRVKDANDMFSLLHRKIFLSGDS